MKISGKTKVYGIVGYPVRHSLSPVFQNEAFKHFSVDAVYVPFEVNPERFKEAFLGLYALGVCGVNITLPFKEKACELCHLLDEASSLIGAVNTVKFGDKIEGYNTDWVGFLRALKEEEELKSKKVLVLGAGGTSRAVLYALSQEECKTYLWNRTKEKAYELAKVFGAEVVSHPEEIIKEVDVIVNTTSVGLSDEDPPIFNYDKIEEKHLVFDVIYKDTLLLKRARERGARVKDGLSMLLYQGIESFKIWTGLEVPLEVVKRAVMSL